MPGPLSVNVTTRVNQVWSGRDIAASGISTLLLMNTDLVNTVKVGSDPTSILVPIAPNGSLSVDPGSNWYVVGLVAGTAPLVVVPNGQANFLGLTQGLGSLAIPSIFSPNFITGVSGWSIQKNGNAEFNNLTIRGTFFGLDFIINSLGIFIYSGIPALGNLVGSWAPAAGANDGLGNAFLKDLTVYNPGTTGYVNVNSNAAAGGNAGVLFHAPGATHINAAVPTQVSGRAINVGAVNEVEILQLTSGQSSSLFSADIALLSESADTTIPAQIQQTLAGVLLTTLLPTVWNIGVPISCTLGTAVNPSIITTDSWHLLTLDTGWSTLGGQTAPQYRMNEDKTVSLVGAAQFTSAITAQNICSVANVLPALYRPANQQYIAAPPGSAGLQVSSNGNLLASAVTATAFCNFNGRINLGI